MRTFLAIFLLISITSCGQDKVAISGETEFQRTINAEYKDASKSPLKAKDLKNFKGLEFFKFDSTYVTKATLKLTPDSDFIEMPTTTSRMSKKRIYGILSFQLKNKNFELAVYQDLDLMNTEGYEDYLFLPFSDNTNGESSYGGGRYIDFRIPKETTIVLDFNKAYNPYCAYNPKYSCPIVPLENHIDTEVLAGVKVFKKY